MLNVAPCHDVEYSLREVTHDATAYYLREGESPGRWWGEGATALGLAGEVDPDALRALFDGRDPSTGAYLVSARGSSARANARAGDADLDVAAVAARLELSRDSVRAKLRSGELAGTKTVRGRWRIPVAAVDAWRAGEPQPSAAGPLPSPGPDATYGLGAAARPAGVRESYLRRLAGRGRPETTVGADGGEVQYLEAAKDDKGHWRVHADELERFMAARSPRAPVPAYDLAMRAPKSVSILHALGHLLPPEHLASLGIPTSVASVVVAAHHAAVADALGLLQRQAAWIRGPGGRTAVNGLTVALFDHRSSRTGDPLLHTHAVVANVATGIDGRRAALDGTAIYAWASTAGHVYQARLRAELVARLGVRFGQPHHGLADVVGVPAGVIDAFSERRRQVLEAMEALGTSGAAAAQMAALATRPPKTDASHRTPDQLAAQAAAVGFGAEELAAVLGHDRQHRLAPDELATVAERLASPGGLTARDTVVDVRDAIRGFATELAGGATGTDLERWATTLLADGQRFVPVLASAPRRRDVIRRADGRIVRAGGILQTYATPELLAHEAALVAAHADGLGVDGSGVGIGVVSGSALSEALAARPTLSEEQVEMVSRITTSGIGIEVVVGGPGAGKTFALGAAAQAWRASGLKVIGAALAGGAADVLGREADLDERFTLTALLARCDRQGTAALAGSVVLVDESGMADTRQLSRLARYAAAAGGDARELASAEDPMAVLVWAAGRAAAVLATQAGPLDAYHRRLALLDDALARQRQSRLAMVELDAGSPVAVLVGPPPHSAVGMAAWRRAAAAVVDYRDAAGLFDRVGNDRDPETRALGPVPEHPALAAHRAQMLGIVAEARLAVAVGELARSVAPTGPRPPVAVEALAQRGLDELDTEAAVLMGAAGGRSTLERRARTAAIEVRRAEEILARVMATPVPAAPSRRWRRPAPVEIDHAAVAEAEAQLATARDEVAAADRALADAGDPRERAELVAAAIALRQQRIAAAVLIDPPSWVLTDLTERLANLSRSPSAVAATAAPAYGTPGRLRRALGPGSRRPQPEGHGGRPIAARGGVDGMGQPRALLDGIEVERGIELGR